jgi:hypothetical protein
MMLNFSVVCAGFTFVFVNVSTAWYVAGHQGLAILNGVVALMFLTGSLVSQWLYFYR